MEDHPIPMKKNIGPANPIIDDCVLELSIETREPKFVPRILFPSGVIY